jgi:hypothetical protein
VHTTLSGAGQTSTSIINPITVTAPGSAVQGYLDDGGQVQTLPGGGSAATYAVDENNGVIVFASGVTGSTVITTTCTVTYSYSTNWDRLIISNPDPSPVDLATWWNRYLYQIDKSASLMAGSGRYVAPNLALMEVDTAAAVASAQIFHKLASPDGTSLYPTEDFFADRNGINYARHNAPLAKSKNRILLTRQGSTFYGVEESIRMAGPYPGWSSDTPSKIIANDVIYAEHKSTFGTPQVQDQAGNVKNPVARCILPV